MSQENVEVVLEAVAAMNRSDTEAFLEAFHPDVVWEESGDVFPGLRGTYRGPAGVRKWFEAAFLEVWENFNVEVTEVANVGDAQVFLGTLTTARGAGSGVETELHAWTSSGSRMARSQDVRSFSLGPKPSKPQDSRSRRCRRRTWRSFAAYRGVQPRRHRGRDRGFAGVENIAYERGARRRGCTGGHAAYRRVQEAFWGEWDELSHRDQWV